MADLRALIDAEHPHAFPSPLRAQYSRTEPPSVSGERLVHDAGWSESGSTRCLDTDEGESVVGKAV
ncbi:hypothetical protein FOMPIDRAFT_1021182 [Fomitopsis schrenkii]|uniref:Uncharacterized protein n=1 Tax=Fomitopsis schrenkii TaxID=2126942 RepID=S8G7J4_FOMSC|nr:hypothetical protein FOMPIDRAFT_1021182 [Fomitopsis schrenkii]